MDLTSFFAQNSKSGLGSEGCMGEWPAGLMDYEYEHSWRESKTCLYYDTFFERMSFES